MTTTEALEHLLHTAKVDPHRLLQQTVCYDWWFSWTFSVSWGYAVQVFGNHMFLLDVLRAQQTFEPWRRGNPLAEAFNFDTRDHHMDPCRRPTVFFFNRANFSRDGRIKSSYRGLIS
ncbi:hypothetical protein Acr_17g0011050 [Actinidia rufa]|uniref:Uncharacterized protein n=1 Tax=Actinidia rufa TaxID=165716 RepID=A0A7J0G427_9ERIC|nr:hypothetical protein Acr_17g0011050 [Actinidia rufa]